jgi:thiol-disulfide isomerase/thioredoxin
MDTGKYINFNKGMPAGGDSGILSKIKSAGGNISYTAIIAIVAGILFIILALLYYFYYVAPQKNAKYQANQGSNEPTNNAELLFFFADWCPHCKTAKPIWDELKSQYQTKTINGYQVIFTEINCTEETAEVDKMMNKYNVEGYPTIKLLKDGQVIEYDAKPSKETLTQFLNTVL